MSASDAIDEDEECPICLLQYDLLHRVPNLLHPPHTFCSACMDVLAEAGQPRHANPSAAASRVVVIACPLCGVEVRHTVGQARVNSVLRERQRVRAAEKAAAALAELKVEDEVQAVEDEKVEGQPASARSPSPPPAPASASERKRAKRAKARAKAQAERALEEQKAVPGPHVQRFDQLATVFHRWLFRTYSALPTRTTMLDLFVESGGVHYAKVHWAFLGRIVRFHEPFTIISVLVEDEARTLCIILVRRNPRDDVDGRHFVVGSTIIVRYAERQEKMPGHRYVDVDNARMVKVIQATPEELMRIEDDRLTCTAKSTRGSAARVRLRQGAGDEALCALPPGPVLRSALSAEPLVGA